MDKYIWLFPVLFIFHDMEEIIGLRTWILKNKSTLNQKFPKISKIFQHYSTEGMAFAVFEEFLLCILICIAAIVFGWYGLWLGCFVAYTIHLIVHLLQAIIMKKYIPALATSVIALPISVWLIYVCNGILDYSKGFMIMYTFIGLGLIGINLKFAHWIMHKFTKWLCGII
ncbi:MAG: HXXEE domain-containing protein, partial [Anaerotignum sp.]|nr:HXXEE domain-containing protein [Anaerotignum sp.]